jgi:hypothetical protein
MKKALLVICVAMLLMSCEKKEKPVLPATSQALTAGMGDAYETMLYFDVNSGLFVSQMPHIGYDLQFGNSPDDRTIFLNSSNFMFVRNFGSVPFESVTDTALMEDWRYDFPTGNVNRTALGKWYNADGSSKNEVFVIDRGYNALGNRIGFVKMMVLSVDEDAFKIRVASLDNSNDTTAIIQKNVDTRLTQFYFKTMSVEEIEPNKNDWHFQFTQYTDFDITDEGDTIPYLVRGVLINEGNTEIARLDGADFESINKEDVQVLSYSNARNAIGFNWKSFSLQTGVYQVLPDIVFIVKEISGNYYKLQFVDYYNDAGEKGYAKFNIEGL